jgi:chromosome segregation ATPase
MLVTTIIAVFLSAAVFLAVFFLHKKKASGSVSSVITEKSTEVNDLISKIQTIITASESLAAKGQLDSLITQNEEAKTNLAKEKDLLKEIEGKLSSVQKSVETKESQHQDMKSAKEEDEAKLAELMAQCETISQESIELEQKLAASLKSLDAIIGSTTMTDEQKAILTELSETLTNASARMRDLLTEFNMVRERLEALTQQHKDLEEEYTRLVEQQLGE